MRVVPPDACDAGWLTTKLRRVADNPERPNFMSDTKLKSPATSPAAHGSATWIRFDELTPNPATKRWAVMPKDGSAQIGMVSWYGPWRKYCFFPMASTVFEWVCLREIAEFCESQTVLHRLDKQLKPRIDAFRASDRITEEDMKLVVR